MQVDNNYYTIHAGRQKNCRFILKDILNSIPVLILYIQGDKYHARTDKYHTNSFK